MDYKIIEYDDTHIIEIDSIIFDLYNMGYVVDVTSVIQKVDIDNTNKTYHLSVFKDHIHFDCKYRTGKYYSPSKELLGIYDTYIKIDESLGKEIIIELLDVLNSFHTTINNINARDFVNKYIIEDSANEVESNNINDKISSTFINDRTISRRKD
jgi:hypothetical protein